MSIDINKLAAHFARTPFQIEVIYRGVRAPGMHILDLTEPLPGFVFPLSGKAEFIFNGTAYILSPGNIVHGGALMTLEQKVLGNIPWEYLLVLYRICGSEPADGFSLANMHFELKTGSSPRLTDLLKDLLRLSVEPGGIPEFQTKALFCRVLEETLICHRNQTSGDSHSLFKNVSEYIHEHYSEDLAVSKFMEQNCVSRNQISYAFKKYSGMGPGEYLIKYRLNRAKEILPFVSASIKEISQAVGFSDPLYFSRAFKKQFGVSPSEYKNRFINNPC